MINRKFVFGGIVAAVVAGSALAVTAHATPSIVRVNGQTGASSPLAPYYENLFSYYPQVAQATPQPATPQPAVQEPQKAAVPQSPYLGIRLEDTAKGVVIRDVIAGSPAATAGFKVDDIVQKANSTAVQNVVSFAQSVLKMKPDDSLKLDVMRADKPVSLNVKIGTEDASKAFIAPTPIAYDGFTYNPTDKSWQVFQLSDHSLLYSAGLRTGDTITGFDGKAIAPADFQTYRDSMKDTTTVNMTVLRADKEQTITVSGAALKTFDAFNYNTNGILIDVLPNGNVNSPNLASLSHVMPVDAIAYNGKSWQIYSLVDASGLQTGGLKINDQISTFDGKAYDPAAMRTWLATLNDTATVKLSVERDGKMQDISIPAADMTSLYLIGDQTSGLFFGMPNATYAPELGMQAVGLTDAIIKEHQLTEKFGAFVDAIQPNSAAAAAGVQAKDVITAINAQKIDAQHDYKSLLNSLKPGEQITLDVMRGDKTMQLKATLPTPDVSGEIPFLIKPL